MLKEGYRQKNIMAVFKHFVITPFNLGLWSKDKFNVSTQTEEWLKKRFELFDKYCFPSVVSQTNSDFIWLCLFDIKTPEHYLERIKSYTIAFPKFQPCFFNDEETANSIPVLQNIIKKYVTPEDEYIVTTNLDNDDVFNTKFIEVLQSTINKNLQEGIYSFNYGYQYFTELNVVLKIWYPNNSFQSLVEKNGSNYKTIRSYPHTQLRKHFDNIDIKSKPYWIEVVHNTNVANDFIVTIKVRYHLILRTISFNGFGLDISVKWYQNIYGTIVKLPVQISKVIFRKLRKKIQKRDRKA